MSQYDKNLFQFQHTGVDRQLRQGMNRHPSVLLWFTGLSGAGKSTLAHAVERKLFEQQCRTYVLDGDNVRHGLCSDLGFSEESRRENIRRIAETAKLMLDAGLIVMTAFISPFREDRQKARALFPHGEFIEIYCATPLEVCEQRDVKGLYRRARAGEVKEFTGISSPYEPPVDPELTVETGSKPLDECVEQVMDFLRHKGVLGQGAG